MFKNIGYLEREQIEYKLKSILAIRNLNNDNYDSFCKEYKDFFKFLIQKRDTMLYYQHIINILVSGEEIHNLRISSEKLLIFIKKVAAQYSMISNIHINNHGITGLKYIEFDPDDLIKNLCYLLNYVKLLENAVHKDKISWNKVKLLSANFEEVIGHEFEYLDTDEDDVFDFIDTILLSCGYKDALTSKIADSDEGNIDYTMKNCIYFAECPEGIIEYRIKLPINKNLPLMQEEAELLDKMCWNIVKFESSESMHTESFSSKDNSNLIILDSLSEFCDAYFIDRLIELLKYCEQLNNKYKAA